MRGPGLDGTGALPLCAAGVDCDLAPDLLISPVWRDEANEDGYSGTAWSAPTTKAATHGSLSPWDMRNTLVAAGPGLRRGLVSAVPTGNIDIAPTMLHLLGLPIPNGLDGRVIAEALVDGPDQSQVLIERVTLTAQADRGGYRQTLQVAKVAHARYIDWGKANR